MVTEDGQENVGEVINVPAVWEYNCTMKNQETSCILLLQENQGFFTTARWIHVRANVLSNSGQGEVAIFGTKRLDCNADVANGVPNPFVIMTFKL